jgi:hypothetical protein
MVEGADAVCFPAVFVGVTFPVRRGRRLLSSLDNLGACFLNPHCQQADSQDVEAALQSSQSFWSRCVLRANRPHWLSG